jgi:uncharacterized protein (DUF1015 family)
MADVCAFPGVRYNPTQVSDMAAVVAPPYDVISSSEQAALYQRHPCNIVRLILARQQATDTPEDNRYTRSYTSYSDWLARGVLTADPRPALYLSAHAFDTPEGRLTRFGLLARVRLEPFERGVIRPHEATFASVKSDRLRLMQACHANFSPIFALFADPQALMPELEAAATHWPPSVTLQQPSGDHHRLWVVEDPRRHRQVAEAFSGQAIYIADGHHRYETALAYRDWLIATRGPLTADHPANFVLMYLCSLESPGLRILPAHRLVRGIPAHLREDFLEAARRRFVVEDLGPIGPGGASSALTDLEAGFRADPQVNAFGLVLKDRQRLYRLRLAPGAATANPPQTAPDPLEELDVTVLNRLAFADLLHLPAESLEHTDQISFTNEAVTAIRSVADGTCEMAFLLKPVAVDQVRRIAENGLTMPRKSTYFAPKVLSGLVIHRLRPEDI